MIKIVASTRTETSQTLNINEVFASVQGETSFSGFPTTFIRLAACNLRCTWCDTTYSFGRGVPVTIESLMTQTAENGCRHVCVTGGEPLLQSAVHSLLSRLCDEGYVVSLETGGSLDISHVDPRVHIILDIKCPASGMEHKNEWGNILKIQPKDEIKFVIGDEKDYSYALEICQRHDLYAKTSNILLSPVHGILNPQSLVAWILRDKIPVRLNLQIHKFIWTSQTRGV
jgi:7-carboxy-7-deazaguanine synthase